MDITSSICVDVSKSILINDYSSQKLIDLFDKYTFLTSMEKTLILSEVSLFIGLSEEGKKSEKVFNSNIKYISDEIIQKSAH